VPRVIAAGERLQLRDLVIERLGFAPSASEEHRLDHALERLMALGGATSLDAPLAALSKQSYETPEWQLVIDALVVGETHFFRQAAWFAQIEEHILKPLIARRLQAGSKRLRLWSAACSTGEEAYTLAIIVDRLLGSHADWDVQIVGSDVNARFLGVARNAVYRAWSLREVEPELRERHFRDLGSGQFELAPAIRDMVSFRLLNLNQPSVRGEDRDRVDIDLIVCRNMLMYFMPEQQAAASRRLVGALAADGWLAVAPAEATADAFVPLVPFNVPSAIFFCHALAATPLPSEPLQRVPAATIARAKAAVSARIPLADANAAGIQRTRALVEFGDFQGARSQCEALLAADSLSYPGNVLLALICDELNDVTAALEAAKHAAYLEPRSAPAHFLCGTALARLGRTLEGRRKMEITLQLLDAGAPAPDSSWDVPAERLREAALAILAGATPANVRSAVGAAK
jgi:chemotaxis protein methyltransferase CheR